MHRLNRGSFEKPLLSQIETMTRTGNAQNWTLDNRPSVCHWIGGSINMSFVIKQTGETGDRYQPVSKIATRCHLFYNDDLQYKFCLWSNY